jgi:NAD(P)-dependent dehydrogenase (short-subunit alcohol dehydrogenase family)
MKGKVCLITGATSGIGKEAARDLLKRGARVVLLGRNAKRMEATRAELQEGAEGVAEVVLVDIGSQAQVRRAAQEILGKYPRIDVLINNAGVWMDQRTVTVDGIETTLAVNHLGPFLLTYLLLDRLKASAPARIVNVASHAHKRGVLRLDDIEGKQSFGRMQTYGQSKLCNVLFTRELARRLEGTGVTANSLHPGVIATELGDGTSMFGWFLRLAKPFLKTPQQGAATTLHLACAPEVEGVTGKYFSDCKEYTPSPQAQDDESARKLWELSVRMTGLADA